MDGSVTLTLRLGDSAVVRASDGSEVTVRVVREEPGRVSVVIVAPREWPVARVPRAAVPARLPEGGLR